MYTPTVIAVYIGKGGTGKTTTAWYLARLLAESGEHVLIIDVDPQANMTKMMAEAKDTRINVSHVIMSNVDIAKKMDDRRKDGLPLRNVEEDFLLDSARQGVMEFIDIVPSDFVDVADADIRLNAIAASSVNPRKHPIHILKNVIERDGRDWDYIIIDCPPSSSLLAMGALAAADTIVIPAQPDAMPVAMVKQTLELIEDVQAITGKAHKIVMVSTMVNAQAANDRKWMSEMGAVYWIPTRDGRDADRELMKAYEPLMKEIHHVS